MTRHLLSIAIVLFFGAMMTFLARDHIIPMVEYGDATTVSGAQLSDTWSGIDEWSRVSFNNAPIGIMRQVVTQTGEGYAASVEAIIETPFLEASVHGSAVMNDRLELEEFIMNLTKGNGKDAMQLAGLVTGGTLYLRLKSPTGMQFTDIRLSDPITLNLTADALMSSAMLRPGESYLMDVYDPLWGMDAGKMRVTMVGDETITLPGGSTETIRVETAMSKIRMVVWLDPETRQPVRREVSYERGRRDSGQSFGGLARLALSMTRIPLDQRSREEYAELRTQIDPPDLELDEMRGENQGDQIGRAHV